jgi:hypothetical protein
MEFLTALWLPILVSAVVVWIASAIVHMVLPFHKSDFGKLPDEEKFNQGLAGVAPGTYMFPYCSAKEMNTPEAKAKMEKGPAGLVTVFPTGPVSMGRNLGLTFLFNLLVSIFVAYLGAHSILPGEPYLERFRFCGTVAFAAYALGWMPFVIWYRTPKFWSNFIDAVIYSLLTAGIFASMWPQPQMPVQL